VTNLSCLSVLGDSPSRRDRVPAERQEERNGCAPTINIIVEASVVTEDALLGTLSDRLMRRLLSQRQLNY